MRTIGKRIWAVVLCALVLLLTQGGMTADALVLGSGGSQSDMEVPPEESYTVTLGELTIGAGEYVEYTTISDANLGGSVTEGYYPGDLTLELTGTIVVEAGGSLSIGTLSLGGPEASPVLSFSQPESRIIVKSGGSLRLTDAVLKAQGSGPVIVQEPGGSVELLLTHAEEGLIQWSQPLVDNRSEKPDDLWLEEGTTLTGDMLPTSMEVEVQVQGTTEWTELPLSWDISGYDGRTQGEMAITGSFLDVSGEPMLSREPLEMTVHWYTPETLVVTDAVWKGDLLPTVQLTVQQLPEYADVWGEVSTDGGVTWERWQGADRFFIVPVEPEGNACLFVLEENAPAALFRIAAQDSWDHTYWVSQAFSLSPPEGEDTGGNRGGSTTPESPDRQPQQPEADSGSDGPTDSETPGDVQNDSQSQKQQSVQGETEHQKQLTLQSNATPFQAEAGAESSQVSQPETGSETDASVPSEADPSLQPGGLMEAATEDQPDLPQEEAPEAGAAVRSEHQNSGVDWRQILLVVAGLAVCALAAVLIALLGKNRKQN